jgi:hypothetical protein
VLEDERQEFHYRPPHPIPPPHTGGGKFRWSGWQSRFMVNPPSARPSRGGAGRARGRPRAGRGSP